MFSFRSKLEGSRAAIVAALLCASCALSATTPVLAAAATEGGEEASLQLVFEPGNFDFGQVRLNGSIEQTTLRLRNSGSAATQVLNFNIAGGSGTFSTGATDCIRTLNPGESCSIQVNFQPYGALPFTAQLHAFAEAGLVVSADLSGEGGRPVFETAVNPVNFGAVRVGSAGIVKSIDVSNTGNMAGGVFIAVIAGGAVGSFHLLDENCTGILLTPAATCNLLVSFQPLSTGAKTARLGLFGDDDGGTQIVLSGVGLEPEPAPLEAVVPSSGTLPAGRSRGRHGARPKPHRGRDLHHGFRVDLANRRAIG